MATILIATADAQLYEIFNAEITGEGHTVLWAGNGQETLELTLENAPHLIFLDTALEIFNAFETCHLIREEPDLPKTLPVVLLSDNEINPKKTEQVSATSVFPKTHDAAALHDQLVTLLGVDAGTAPPQS